MATVDYDVVICGGGLAGLSLARQLRRELPRTRVAVVDLQERPLPAAAHKVGESCVELSAHYFQTTLGLEAYLEKHQLPKNGLRYFFGDAQGPVHERPELGNREFPPVPSYQLDRGTFENDLREMVAADGVELLEGYRVMDVELGTDGAAHQVRIARGDSERKLRGRWLIDALGRRRLLQTKLGLKRDSKHYASAAWFRLPGRVDIEDMVPAEQRAWHERVRPGQRYYSTNHFMGRGYWFWFIPLASDATSLGLVTDETIHPLHTYNTYERLMGWLERHEPEIRRFIRDRPVLDFKVRKNYSYSSARVFSGDRWACIGDAGAFVDPFYSPGSDFIGTASSMVTKMVGMDARGEFRADVADLFNRFYLGLFETTLDLLRNSYPVFGTGHVMACKVYWDWFLYWGYSARLFFDGVSIEPAFIDRLSGVGRRMLALNARVQQLFRDWARNTRTDRYFEFVDPRTLPMLFELHLALEHEQPPERTFEGIERHLGRMEELAQVLFFAALQEIEPARLAELPTPRWVNAWAIDLRPEKWQAEGLLAPSSPPRDLSALRNELIPILGPC